jgi:hypothetical protein
MPSPRQSRDGPPARIARALWRFAGMALVACLAFGGAAGARAQALESALSPGEMSAPHAKLEGECQKCHVRFERNAQDRLCMDCHKDVAQDLRSKARFHGRLPAQACRACHSEHKGSDFKLVQLDPATFDHGKTEFALRTGHLKPQCSGCHVPGKGYRLASRECIACHRKDDVHKGSLGARCEDCHAEARWKEVGTRFDHNKTRYPLTGKHESAKCEGCHKDTNYRETPHACIACHRADDKHKGRFADKCETCHVTRDWKTTQFNHDTDTKYPLLGRHRTAKCESCHTGANVYREKTPTGCVDCHRNDDKHKGTLGNDCARCHTERSWKEPPKFDHARTSFPLTGKHASVTCKSCHQTTMFKEVATTCIGCHRKDDVHKGTLGEGCKTCHDDRDWKHPSFDHQKTAFPLHGKHQTASCRACHRTPSNYKEAPRECFGCHQKDDRHEGQEGRACGNCHDERVWKPARFDHGLSRFPLLGQHARTECKGCHLTPRYKDARLECVACHAKDDKHKRTLGVACETCHNPRTWKAWDFDHDKRTRYPLDGKHVSVACAACHTKPAEGKVEAPTLCVGCHAKNDVHEGSYGRQCQQCHVTSSFRTIRARPSRTSSAAPARTGRLLS